LKWSFTWYNGICKWEVTKPSSIVAFELKIVLKSSM
jgi:hypothetical protein